ncbi:cation:proton antiporter [uncultured Sphingomonas sp.]|uniref:cation:proton antiporter n=1 Tax=uncultured Sphingomonas sp. TaxID=158754 RepID=UPI0035CB28D1
MDESGFLTIGGLFLAAILVAIGAQRLRLPYSIGLVVAGLGIALVAPGTAPPLTRDLIYFILLPPLVFEAAIQIPWRPLRRELPLLLALVTLGVAVASGVVAAGMHYWAGWSWIGAGLFGVLISATDPVSVIAAFKQWRVEPRLHLLVEAESLLNDGVAAVGFAVLTGIAVAGAGAGDVSLGAIGWQLLYTSVGGIGIGVGVAVPLILVAGGTDDRLVEVTITTLIAFGAFLVAEHLGCSGVLATLAAGLVVGNWGFPGTISDDGRRGVLNHWEYVAFLGNSVIFLLIGGSEARLPIGVVVEAAALAIGLSLAGRALSVYPMTLAFARTRLAVPWAYKHVLFWGGLRGALALALALALPGAVPERATIVAVVFAVVAFSIVVQGLTMGPLIRRLGLIETDAGHA